VKNMKKEFSRDIGILKQTKTKSWKWKT
jgi:hypothetical protein